MIKDGQFYIDFPDPYKRRELNSKYREIPLKDTTSRQLRKYFNAMANLYGIIPLRKAYEIISSQSPKLVTRDEFLAFSEIARHECEDYYILGLDELYVDGKLKDVLDREIIDVSLIGDGLDRYHALLKSQRGKPYYVPSKAQLLAYDDAFYCEPTEETNQMREFIETRLQLPERKRLRSLMSSSSVSAALMPISRRSRNGSRRWVSTFLVGRTSKPSSNDIRLSTIPPGCRATVAIPPMSF